MSLFWVSWTLHLWNGQMTIWICCSFLSEIAFIPPSCVMFWKSFIFIYTPQRGPMQWYYTTKYSKISICDTFKTSLFEIVSLIILRIFYLEYDEFDQFSACFFFQMSELSKFGQHLLFYYFFKQKPSRVQTVALRNKSHTSILHQR